MLEHSIPGGTHLCTLYRYVPPDWDIVILRCSLDGVTKLQYPPQRAKRKRHVCQPDVIKFNKAIFKGRL